MMPRAGEIILTKYGENRMNFGCCVNMIADDPYHIGYHHLAAVKELGFDYVELPIAEITLVNEKVFQKILEELDVLKLPCSACNNFFPPDFRLTGPDVDMRAIDTYLDKLLPRASALRPAVIVFGSGKAKWIPDGFDKEKAWIQIVELLRHISDRLAGHDIRVAIEPLRKMECNIINSYVEGCSLVRDVDRENIRMLVDFYHLSEEREPLSHILENRKSWLIHAHTANPMGRIYPKENDEINQAPFIHVLRELGYEYTVSCEAYAKRFKEDARSALIYLRNLDK